VANEEEAYKYWIRIVSARLKAEQAYGPRVIYRLPYVALIDDLESTIRSLLDFLDEPYGANVSRHSRNGSIVPTCPPILEATVLSQIQTSSKRRCNFPFQWSKRRSQPSPRLLLPMK